MSSSPPGAGGVSGGQTWLKLPGRLGLLAQPGTGIFLPGWGAPFCSWGLCWRGKSTDDPFGKVRKTQ